jgi:predicted PurR-regulated permease PerM
MAQARVRKKPIKQARMIRVWTLVILRVIAILAALFLVCWLVYMLRALLLLLILSVFFCYLIAPLVRLLEQPVYASGREYKLPRAAAIGVVYAAMGGALMLAISFIWPLLWQQVTDLAKNLPSYISSASSALNKSINDANSWMRHLKLPREWRDEILRQTGQLAQASLPWVEGLIGGIVGLLTYVPWLILVPLLSFFLLKDASSFEQTFVDLMPNERLKKRAYWLMQDVSATLAGYIRAQLTACLVVWAMVTAGLAIIGVPYALVLGTVSGALEFVPMFGPLLAAVITISLTLTTSWEMALGVAVFLGVLRIIQDYVIYPRIVGHGIKMHPLLVVLAILAGAEIAGVAGIFLAIPVVGLIIVGYNHYVAYRSSKSHRVGSAIASEAAEPEGQLSPSGSTRS